MHKQIFLVTTMIGFISVPIGHALHCYQCIDCESATKVECNDEAVVKANNAIDTIYYKIPTNENKTFRCFTMVYNTDDSRSKVQGCIYSTHYICKVPVQSYSSTFICWSCDWNYCNSSTSFSDLKITFTMLATLIAFVAMIL